MNEHDGVGPTLAWTDSLGFHIKRAEQAIVARKAEMFKTLGLTVPQAQALCLLLDGPPKSCTHISREAYVTSQTMTGILSNLLSQELVLRFPSPDHARVHLFELTDEGRALALRARFLGMSIEEELLGAIAPEAHAPVLAALNRVAELAPQAGASLLPPLDG